MVVIFVEFPVMHSHFDPVLNASVLTAQAAMRVYMFHSLQFHASVMSPFFALVSRSKTLPWMTSVHLFILRGTQRMRIPALTLG